jgi:hypothetical protein
MTGSYRMYRRYVYRDIKMWVTSYAKMELDMMQYNKLHGTAYLVGMSIGVNEVGEAIYIIEVF